MGRPGSGDDRLRKAADVIDRQRLRYDDPSDRAVAAMLRSVAAGVPHKIATLGRGCDPHCPRCAALAVADTVLGSDRPAGQ